MLPSSFSMMRGPHSGKHRPAVTRYAHYARIHQIRKSVRKVLTDRGSSLFVTRPAGRVLPVLALLTLSAAFLLPLPNSYRAVWVSRLLDALHAPALAIGAGCLYMLTAGSIPRTLFLTGAAAVAFEVLQAGVNRSTSARDLIYGGFGLVAAWLLLRLLESKCRARARHRRIILSIGVMLAPLGLELPILLDAWSASRDFPVQADFSSRWETHRWHRSGVTIRRVHRNGRWRAEISNQSSGEYGSAILFPVVADWSEFERLCCEFSFGGPPMSIVISVRDVHGRIDIARSYKAGTHRVCLNLQDAVTFGDRSRLNLERVQSFHFVFDQSPGRRALLHSVTLE